MRPRSRTVTVYVPTLIVLTVVPADVVSVITWAGPVVRTSLVLGVTGPARGGVGGEGEVGGLPTVKAPRIDVGWTSQTNVYRPSVNVTFHVTSPVNSTPVVSFTPGPWRWKLWKSERSRTWISYAPGSSLGTRPRWASSREIAKSGPTVPKSFVSCTERADPPEAVSSPRAARRERAIATRVTARSYAGTQRSDSRPELGGETLGERRHDAVTHVRRLFLREGALR